MISYVKLQKTRVLISDFYAFQEGGWGRQLARYFWSFSAIQNNWEPKGSRLKHNF